MSYSIEGNSSNLIVLKGSMPDENATSPDECYRPQIDTLLIIIVTLDIILSAASILGNLLVISSVARFRQLRTVTNVFVVGLAAADLLVGLNVPYYVAFYFDTDVLHCRRTSCLLRYWFTIYASECSMFCMMGVAVDRYVAILHPLSYHNIMHTRLASLYLLLIWLAVGAVSSLPLLGIGEQFDPLQECELYYTHTREYVLAAVASLVLLTFLVTTSLYMLIFWEAFKQKRALMEWNNSVHQETRTAWTMALVLGVNFLGFLPYFSVISLRYVSGINHDHLHAVKPFAVCCYFGKSAINPVIYGWKNKEFRLAFRKLVIRNENYV